LSEFGLYGGGTTIAIGPLSEFGLYGGGTTIAIGLLSEFGLYGGGKRYAGFFRDVIWDMA